MVRAEAKGAVEDVLCLYDGFEGGADTILGIERVASIETALAPKKGSKYEVLHVHLRLTGTILCSETLQPTTARYSYPQ